MTRPLNLSWRAESLGIERPGSISSYLDSSSHPSKKLHCNGGPHAEWNVTIEPLLSLPLSLPFLRRKVFNGMPE